MRALIGLAAAAVFVSGLALAEQPGSAPGKAHKDDGDTIVCKRAQVPSASQRNGTQFALGLMLGIAVDMALMMTGWLIQMNS